jgi:hypothetical protein
MGLELDVSPYGKYIDCGSLTTKPRGKYLDLRECKKQDNCENCIVRSFVIWYYQSVIFLECSIQGGWAENVARTVQLNA